MKRKIIALFMAVMMVTILVAGCTPTKTQEQTVNLRMLYPGTSDFEKKLAVDIQKEVKKQHPNINLEIIFLSWPDIEKKLVTMSQSNDAPDLMIIQDVTNPASMDLLEPVDGYFNSKLNKDMFLKAPLEYMQLNGKQYAVPVLAIPYSHIVNTDMLTKAGFKTSDLKTWSDVETAVKSMTKNGQYGYGMANGGEGRFTFRDFMMAAVSNDFTPDDVSDASKTKYIETLKLFNDMSDSMPKTQVTWLHPELFKALSEQQIGMQHTGSYFTANLVPNGSSLMPKMQPFIFPAGPSAKEPKAMVGSVGVSIVKGSKHKAEAWQVIETIMEPTILGEWAGAMNVPAVNYITKDMLVESAKIAYPDAWEDHLRIMNDFSTLADKYGTPMPKILGQPQMERIVQVAMIKMLDKKITPEQAYDEIRAGIEKVKASL